MKICGNISELKEQMKKEAIDALTKKPIITYSIDRVIVWHDAFLLSRDLPTQPQKYAAAFRYFCENISLPIDDKDILIGRMTEKSFTEEEEAVFEKEYMSEPGCHGKPDFITDGGHCTLRWDTLFKEGLPALKNKAEKWLEYYKANGNDQQVDFLTAAVSMYDSMLIFIKRYGEECRRKNKLMQAEIFDELLLGAPKSFISAMQLYWTVTFMFCAYICFNPTLTLGRPDLFLYELYKKDIENNELTKEEASLIIADFYAKNNLIMGRGEHQISEKYDSRTCTGWHRILAYDAPQYLVLSGTDPESGKIVANELTKLFIDEIVPSYKNPVIELRYSEGFAKNYPALWETFVKKQIDSASAMIYNDISILKAYMKDGYSFKEAATYEHYGCNWPTLPGKDNQVHEYQGRIALAMEDFIHEYVKEYDVFDRETFLKLYYEYCLKYYKETAEQIKANMKHDPNSGHIKLFCLFTDNCIEKAGLYFENYNIIMNLANICTVIDITCAMEYLSLEKGISLKKLMEVCDKDFEDEPYLLALCKNAPKAGDGSKLSDFYIGKILNLIIDSIEEAMKDIPDFCRLRFCLENDTGHIGLGLRMGATPDGRRKGQPISQNSQPAHGSCKNGITAMLGSMVKLPFNRCVSGAMNMMIEPKTFSGDEGLKKLCKLMEVYFEKGGLQLQISAVDKAKLLDAQKNPDNYRDLMVRVTGYSAVFVDLSLRAQQDIIARDSL